MALANYKISKDILLSVFVPAAVSGSLLCGIRLNFEARLWLSLCAILYIICSFVSYVFKICLFSCEDQRTFKAAFPLSNKVRN